jgi:hypothetical protein
MTTPQDMQDRFNKDYWALVGNQATGEIGAAQVYQNDLEALTTAQNNYKSIILQKLDACRTAEGILIYLQMYVFQNSLPPSDPHADDCLFGIYGDEVGLQGQALQVNSYLTAVHNDLQQMVDSDSPDVQVVENVIGDLDSLLDSLKNDLPLQHSMDPTALANLTSTDQALRNEFWGDGDTTHNPPSVADPTTSGYSYHFVWGQYSPGYGYYINNFHDMETYMKQTGDKDEATEGYKNLTDNLNSATGMTQTVNSEINEKINQLTNFIKTLLGFYENGLLQPTMKLINTAIQNQSKGS